MTPAPTSTVPRVRILGMGMGPQHITPEVAAALRTSDYVIAAEKTDHDALLDLRREIAGQYGLDVVAVPDPPRERASADYPGAVTAWHSARAASYETVLRERGGIAVFLVWGDPSLYDSTIRVVEMIAQRIPITYDVLPGISAPQLLAARHRIVLHPVGQPVHITTARRLRHDIAGGHTNLMVMLTGSRTLSDLGRADLKEWSLWWGANLGSPSEELVAGHVGVVLPNILHARDRAGATAGWVMDLFLMRAP
ncbi:MAG: precorrin-6A synthase (deacetylating) [Actinomycetota bacterium]